MKKLRLTLKTKGKTISDDTYSYTEENKYKVLKYNDILLKFKLLKKDFIFIRETKEDVFKVENRQGSITLMEINQTFDIELSKCDYRNVDNTYYIRYSLEGDDSIIEMNINF